MHDIEIIGAEEGNLQHVSLRIPRNQLVGLTGVSGSGKSTLAMQVLYHECQRQYLEAMAFQGNDKPRVQQVRGATPAICITQQSYSQNPRSTLGTVTDLYSDLRMLYEKLGERACPSCGAVVPAYRCKEEVDKHGDGTYTVYRTCCACGTRTPALTSTHFSFNTKEGACPQCGGTGNVLSICEENVLHPALSLDAGAVDFWEQAYRTYQVQSLYAAYRALGLSVPEHQPVETFSPLHREILLHGVECETVRTRFVDFKVPKRVAEGRFEGVYPTLWRRYREKKGIYAAGQRYFCESTCPACGGERLMAQSRAVTVQDIRLPQLSHAALCDLLAWTERIERTLAAQERAYVRPYLRDVRTKVQRLVQMGLGYLTLDRQTMTLSGGEAQRIKLAASLCSELCGVLYILDEPTVGLHPRDTQGMIAMLQSLRDLGNTVVVIEHDESVIRAMDHLIDLGPGAGRLGGQVVACGTPEAVQRVPQSVTGEYLRASPASPNAKEPVPQGEVIVRHACRHNLRDLTIRIPTGCLVGVSGVSGSGKSTLVFEVLAQGRTGPGEDTVEGLAQFDRVIAIGQNAIARMRRSNVATFCGAYDGIRALFAAQQQAQARGLTARDFSFNVSGGRCEQCEGLGVVKSHNLFFADQMVPCPACGGAQFQPHILEIAYAGRSIREVLSLNVDEAARVFADQRRVAQPLSLLRQVGLGYLLLGQDVCTLSGGEGQRLKLSRELLRAGRTRTLYLMDEPTTGLHPADVAHFLTLLRRLVEHGDTVMVVEHNVQVLRQCDHLIDLGPGGGTQGGAVVVQGTPAQVAACAASVTGRYL